MEWKIQNTTRPAFDSAEQPTGIICKLLYRQHVSAFIGRGQAAPGKGGGGGGGGRMEAKQKTDGKPIIRR